METLRRWSLWPLLFTAVIGGSVRQASGDRAAVLGSVAIRDITPVVGVPLGGFGGGPRRLPVPNHDSHFPFSTLMSPSRGVLDPIHAKVMLLQSGQQRLLWIGLDTVGVTADLRKKLFKTLSPLGFTDDQVLVSATHTHSGPGTLTQDWVFEMAAMDLFQPQVFDSFTDGILEAVRAAMAALEPVQLYSESFDVTDLQSNRRNHPGHFDRQAHLLLLQSIDGQWLGGLLNLAVHGTALDEDNLLYSADVPGALERGVAQVLDRQNQVAKKIAKKVGMIFINGAEGDVSPHYRDLSGIQKSQALIAGQVAAALPRLRPVAGQWRLVSTLVDLGAAQVSAQACVPSSGNSFPVTRADGQEYSQNVGDPKTRVSALKIGDLRIVTWPGEPTTSLGLASKQLAHSLEPDIADAWVVGLTDDHLAYFTTPDEYREGGYESCMTFYGPHSGDKILAAQKDLLKSLAAAH